MMNALRTRALIAVAACAAAALHSSFAAAQPVVVPPDLQPGDRYFLVFVTRDYSAAVSSDRTTYDQFVMDQAALEPSVAALGTNWLAVVSTLTSNAWTTIAPAIGGPFLTTIPVYNTGGQRVSGSVLNMFNFATLQGTVSYDQFGTHRPGIDVWTGTDWNGYSGGAEQAMGEFGPFMGSTSSLDYRWLNSRRMLSRNGQGQPNLARLYAFSNLLIVPGTPVCLGDINGDHSVNTGDLVEFLAWFGHNVPVGEHGDLNFDSAVDTADLVLFLGSFGEAC